MDLHTFDDRDVLWDIENLGCLTAHWDEGRGHSLEDLLYRLATHINAGASLEICTFKK